jgi:N-methylhydantoinase A/oxoprolinase/acetone carboxylase beta subunit
MLCSNALREWEVLTLSIVIGIDTGGTYTDAVIYNREKRQILYKSKSPTTRENLTLGIGQALDGLPASILAQAQSVALSTTLATNACVEHKGCRARLILIGVQEKVMHWIGADQKYGLCYDDVLCVEATYSMDGTVAQTIDWDQVTSAHEAWFSSASALSVAGELAMKNGAVSEKQARDYLKAKYHVPVVMASELANKLNVFERGATALLNARLLPVIQEFTAAVKTALQERGIQAKVMIVRSDGSLMTEDMADMRPVETILSGPAASVRGGGRGSNDDALIVDMGGTTTDVSILRGGRPVMSDGGITIGGWRTQISGVFTDTFALGGDSAIHVQNGVPVLLAKRVIPLCTAATRWPKIRSDLDRLERSKKRSQLPLHEFLCLMRTPDAQDSYTADEQKLCAVLKAGPVMLFDLPRFGLHPGRLHTQRLESEGILMRCGLTPTDMMHIRGDFTNFDTQASILAAKHVMRHIPRYDRMTPPAQLAADIYEAVREKLFTNLARILLHDHFPEKMSTAVDNTLEPLIQQIWRERYNASSFFNLKLDAGIDFIGIGGPTHLFLPQVAEAFGARCIIPEDAEVANALGAASADIDAQASVSISPIAGGANGYLVHLPTGTRSFETYNAAVAQARTCAMAEAESLAHARGAWGTLTVTASVKDDLVHDAQGAEIYLGTTVTANAQSSC